MKLILLGSPGSGKGTQSKRITEDFGILQISTGDIFRYNIKEKTPLGQKVSTFLEKGELVPDYLTCELVEDRLSQEDVKESFLLDGFPRTITQAEELDKFLDLRNDSIDFAINIEVDYSELEERICGRRVCSNCSSSFHVKFFPPKITDVCDYCGGKLIQRDDDKKEVVESRINVYKEQTFPLIKYYKDKNILYDINGLDTPDNVYKSICDVLFKKVVNLKLKENL